MEIKEMRSKVVWIPFGVRPAIAKALNVSEKSVSQAINGNEDSAMSRKIRYVALKEYGGVAVKYYDEFVPDCDTVIDNDTHDMEAIYSDRVKVVYNEERKVAGVYIDGDLKSTHIIKSIADYMDLQKSVQDVVNELVR